MPQSGGVSVIFKETVLSCHGAGVTVENQRLETSADAGEIDLQPWCQIFW
jgi:hypothetical protein